MPELEKSIWLGDWYVLSSYESAIPEGTASEWREVLEGLRHEHRVAFRRVQLWFDGEFACLNSPRNSVRNVEAKIHKDEIDAFIAQAEALLDEHEQLVGDGSGI